MSELASKTCAGSARVALKDDQIQQLLDQVSGWKVVDAHHLFRHFGFDDFVSALAFTNQAGDVAEKLGHHPNIHLSWGTVKIEIYTHDVNGLSECDFILAARLNDL